jgi:hypothetical protein
LIRWPTGGGFEQLNDQDLPVTAGWVAGAAWQPEENLVVLGVLAVFVSWNYCHREPVPAPPGLKVDVLVPVFKGCSFAPEAW